LQAEKKAIKQEKVIDAKAAKGKITPAEQGELLLGQREWVVIGTPSATLVLSA
jgi:hypothetical protein